MIWAWVRRWSYGLMGLGIAILLSIGGLFSDYGRVFAAGHKEFYLPANADTVHWGYFSQSLEP
ncbi:MAG: acetamidase, partial [Cyanobacteria bacterium P01_F01_bin.4]